MLRTTLLKGEKGQSMVEFALLLPILILILLMIMEGGLIFGGYLELQNAARDGARYASVHTDKQDQTSINTYITGKNFIIVDKSNLVQPIGFTKVTNAQGTVLTVTLTYKYPIITPIIGGIIGDEDDESKLTVITSATMRGE